MFDLAEVGAHPSQQADGTWQVRFGVYMPGITFPKGYRVKVRVIHEADQFIRGIEPRDFDLWYAPGPLDIWEATVLLDPAGNPPGAHFGQEGRYLYRYQLLRGGRVVTTWFADPFGRESGLGTLSAFRVGPAALFNWTDAGFMVPEVDDLVVYELHVGEFNGTFDGVVAQLEYLRDLGVNALELMPVTNVKEEVEWGYTPLGFFAPDDRYGGPDGMRRLVNACHAKEIAVILDAVYAHAHPEYPYNLIYQVTGEVNPMMGRFEGEFFAQPGMDYRNAFTRDYFLTVNRHWIEEYHVDGFRYDYVPGMYDGPAGVGYARLVYETYRLSQGGIARFQAPGGGRSLIIQCAEHLPDPRGILTNTYSNACWQNGLLDRAAEVAGGGSLVAFAHQLDPGFIGYPAEYRNSATGEVLPVAPFQYIDSHDHSRFLSRIAPDGPQRDLLDQPMGDRSRAYRVQPYVIALYAGKGIPMLWHGQEFAENWSVPGSGIGRNLFGRPLHWEYFYDPEGKALVRLHRIMGAMRRSLRCLNSRGFYYYFSEEEHRRRGVIAFRRHADADPAAGLPEQDAIVLLNFWNDETEVSVEFPRAGGWIEQIDLADQPRSPIMVANAGERQQVRVPPNYGCVYLL
jgi:1,4-alpha-glucan branching enzyme